MQMSLKSQFLKLAVLLVATLTSVNAQAGSNFMVHPSDKIEFEVPMGTVAVKAITVQNVSDHEITIQASARTDGSFRIEMLSEIILEPKQKAAVTITYIPTSPYSSEGSVSFMEGNSVATVKLYGKPSYGDGTTDEIDFPEYVTIGPVEVGKSRCTSVQLANTGRSTVTIEYYLAGYSKEFNLPTDGKNTITLEAGMKTTVDVCFEPVLGFGSKEELIFVYSFDGGVTNAKASAWLIGIIGSEIDKDAPCLAVNERLEFGPVMLGKSSEGYLYLMNQSDVPVTVTGMSIEGPDAGTFSSRWAFPITIDPNSKSMIGIDFTPVIKNVEKYSATAILKLESDSADCTTASVELFGWTAVKNQDDLRNPIFADGRNAIGIEWLPGTVRQKVVFYNNLAHEVEIKNVALRDGVDFKLVETYPGFPTHLKADESITLVLSASHDKVYFTDEVIFTTDQSTTTEKYDLQGVMQTAAVDPEEHNVSLTISPNPSASSINVAVSNAASASIQVHDLSGRLLTTATSTHWTWDAKAEGRSAGSYFITISGSTNEGKAFSTVRRVVIE